MIHLYLDDFRPCPKGFVLAKNAEECKMIIDEYEIDILSLDYDLGWGEPNGLTIVHHLIETGKFPKRIYLHTSSASGRMQMYELLKIYLPDGTKLFGGAVPPALLFQIGTQQS